MDRNLTILIAEDSEDDALFLQRAFRKIGMKNAVQILTDGQEVLDYLRGEGKFQDRRQFPFPSVLFTDIKMPRVTASKCWSGCGTIPSAKSFPPWSSAVRRSRRMWSALTNSGPMPTS
jgi:CheY-like chemotaxis protein